MTDINKIIHEPARLRIMAALAALDPHEEIEFPCLRDLFTLTDGNLGAHLIKLESAGYVHISKRFRRRKPHTFISITRKGNDAFRDHVAALERILHQPPATTPDPVNQAEPQHNGEPET